ncbi:MAG TPA: Rid family hydrolase [Longimicrobiales bacterium]|nr:Rid family hydrolase [Longimicrobiales bacterium]
MKARGRGGWLGALALVATLAGGCTIEERTDRAADETPATSTDRRVFRPGGSSGTAPLSSAVRSGDLIFLSGALGTVSGAGGARLVEGGVGAETRQALDNLAGILEMAGATMTDVLKCTVFLADIADIAEMSEAYAGYFPSEPPARTTVGAEIAAGGRVEIECIAAAPTGS